MSEHYSIIAEIAKQLPHHELYIEIGTSDGQTFRRVAPMFKRAMGIDIRPDLGEFVTPYGEYYGGITSDDFFKHIAPSIKDADLIFIDACHDHDFSYRDFVNASKIVRELEGLIILHDCFPPTEGMVAGGCSDSYKTAIKIREHKDFESITLPCGVGITICRYIPGGRHLTWIP